MLVINKIPEEGKEEDVNLDIFYFKTSQVLFSIKNENKRRFFKDNCSI